MAVGGVMSQPDLFDNRPVFQLKGGTLAATVLELAHSQLAVFERQLADKVAQAPQLLRGSPVILGLDRLAEADATPDLLVALSACQRQGLHVVAVRAVRPQDIAAANELGMLVLPPGRSRERALESSPEQPAEVTAVAVEPAPPMTAPSSEAVVETVVRPTRLVTEPVRGGQQIYSPGDLIVMAQVSAGAELIAEGHIHVYGALRGRALAGARGDAEARVFCQQLHAELVAVAGRYQVADDLKSHARWGQSAQIFLTDDALQLAAL